MLEKKSSPTTKSRVLFPVLFLSFVALISIFTIYEFLTIGNPFMDPVTPNILWGSILLVRFSFAFRCLNRKK